MMEVIGYFSWTTRNGRISCEKCDAEIRKNAMPESIARRQEQTVQEHPLDEKQWLMSLEHLATVFPLVVASKSVDVR